jgi:hypothetical protein
MKCTGNFATGLVSAEEVYASIGNDSKFSAQAESILLLRHLLNSISDFDPQWGNPLPQSLSSVLKKTSSLEESKENPMDRVARIMVHVEESLKRILQRQRTSVVRNRIIMPVHAAREFDSTSMSWLSRKPGRNIREKLSGNPYLLAVERRMSNNTTENRLLKAFALRFKELLSSRLECFPEDLAANEMLGRLSLWLRSEETQGIDRWNHLPPNNTLLQNRAYRTVWDSWCLLQTLEADLICDSQRLQSDWTSLLYWLIASRLHACGAIRLPEQPCSFHSQRFQIKPRLDPLSGLLDPKGLTTSATKKFTYGDKSDFQLRLDEGGMEIRLTVKETSTKIECSPAKGETASVDVKISDSRSKTWTVSMDLEGASKICETIIKQHTKGKRKSGAELSSIREGAAVADHAVIDIGSLYPRATNHKRSSSSILPFRLLMQYWGTDRDEPKPVDLWNSKAVALRPETTCVSILNVLSSDTSIKDDLLDRAAMSFGARLKAGYDAKKVTYLYPDGVNEFLLKRIRKSINFHFDDATPLPRSIAAAFSLQYSAEFKANRLKPGDCLAVLDYAEHHVTITPLVATSIPSKTKKILGEEAVCLERHPSISVADHEEFCSTTRTKKILESQNCTFADELAPLIGHQGLLDEGDSLSWVNQEDKWFTPKPVKATMPSTSQIASEALMDGLGKACRRAQPSGRIFVLQLHDLKNGADVIRSISAARLQQRPLKTLAFQPDLGQGGFFLEELQAKVPNVPLWKDHLPDLAMRILDERKGQFVNFDLVKNKTVVPINGKSVSIKIKETFTLPKGQPFYSFPLVQGKSGRKIHYVAKIRSSGFPLSEDVNVRLEMTYTYGSDDPYSLTFIPLMKDVEKLGFKLLKVKWEREDAQETQVIEEAASPQFPDRPKWNIFKKWPKRDHGTSNLIDWIQRSLDRTEGTICSPWITDKNGEVYCFVDTGLDEIFCHSRQWEKDVTCNRFFRGDKIYFTKITSKNNKPSASKVSVENKFSPNALFALRFHILTVWNNGQNLSEPVVPAAFRKIVKDAIDHCERLLLRVEKNFLQKGLDSLEREAFFFLSCLHTDAPEVVFQMLEQVIDSKDLPHLPKYHRNLAYSIGYAKEPVQLYLWDNVIEIITSDKNPKGVSTCLQIMGIAVWRCRELIRLLSGKQVKEVSDKLRKALRDTLQGEKKQLFRQDPKTNRKYVAPFVIQQMELLLGLLRTRESEDDEIRKSLVPGSEISMDFARIIEAFTDKIGNLDFESRIQIELDKPKAFQKTPDLLYALRLYLKGETGAGSIRISRIQESG